MQLVGFIYRNKQGLKKECYLVGQDNEISRFYISKQTRFKKRMLLSRTRQCNIQVSYIETNKV